ncbi:DUF1643 domain-containing protein [Flavobacteriaceae bacterium]|nr:DUF1643 domain-containing protein [Flavobacteriaceae bacterium]
MVSPTKNNIVRKVKLSLDKKHRLMLSRHWNLKNPSLLYIMFNPSIADDKIDDPTIRRLISFSKTFNYGGFYVANLYTYITPNPKIIDTSVGVKKNNLKIIMNLTNKVEDIVYAWGNSIVEPRELRNLITSPLCFGKNTNGSPKHPLYLSSKSKLIKFR